MENNEIILRMDSISKSFSNVRVLNNVGLTVRRGEVHVLIGENGAGKSTLMKILIGMYMRDHGTINFKGKDIHIKSTKEALDLGISMIHQELSAIPDMTVAENIFLGREIINPVTRLVDRRKTNKLTKQILTDMKIVGIEPNVKMKKLSIAQTQMVEIAKAISYSADLIIMDEPTSAITDVEIEKLFDIIRSLKEKGTAIIYISHKLEEIYKISDVITILRDGEYITTEKTTDLEKNELIRLMVGRELKDLYYKSTTEFGDVVLEVKNFSNEGLFRNINFAVRKGEILGIAGLMGAGRTEIVETIFGMRGKYSGEIYKNGELVHIHNERDAKKCKIALATEDRKSNGLFLGISIRHNISYAWLNQLTKFGFVNRISESAVSKKMIGMLHIKVANDKNLVNTLSGGNQQKVVLSKWLLTDPDVLILDEPTRGIDVGAKAEIYKIMDDLTKSGKAIIMISSEMPEIIGMSDRILVIGDGEQCGFIDKEEASQEGIMFLACKI